MGRMKISSGVEWEATVGYSRAVRVGAYVAVSGTTAARPDQLPVGGNDIAGQTFEVLRRIEWALSQAGASLNDVVRTRIFVTDISRWREVGLVHAAFFGDTRPATTMVGVSALIDPALLVEIEADAIVE